MTSRRAASIASRFSSRFSSRYSARLSPPLAPPTPRLRWAAALAVAYLAVAGCAAQADNANQAAAQAAAQSASPATAAVAVPASGTLLPPPSQLYGDLFVAVQTAQLYPDQKTFVDATPDGDPATIVQLYQQQKSQPGFSLKAFVAQHFTPPPEGGVTPPPNQTLRQHRLAVAAAHAHEHDGAAVQLADPAAEAVCRARRPLPRRLLLGHLFHDARAAGVGPRGSRRQHARQLRPSDRHDRAHPERQPHVLREPLAAAVLRVHGHARRAGRRRQGLSEIPAGTAQGTCVLDAGRSHDAARAGHAPCGRDARRRGAEPLLGRERYAARRVVSRGRDDREVGAGASGERGLPRPARGRRKRLGLQLALVRRRQDARDDPHDVDRAGRPEQPDVPSRDDDREGLRGHARRGMRDRFFRARARGGRPRSTAICGTAKATTATTTGSSASRATR